MNAYAYKSVTKDGVLSKHYIGLNDREEIVIARRSLIPMKEFETYSFVGWRILKVYKQYAIIEKTFYFLPETADFVSDCIKHILNQ